MRNRDSIRVGLVFGAITVYAILLGLTGLAGTLVRGWFDLSSLQPGALMLLGALALGAGSMTVRRSAPVSWRHAVVSGLVTGAVGGLLVGAFTWLAGSLAESGSDIRKSLVQLTPENIRLLTMGLAPATAGIAMTAIMVIAGGAGAALVFASAEYSWRERRSNSMRAWRQRILDLPSVERLLARPDAKQIALWVGAAILLLLPLVAGRYWNYTLGTVGLYVILGLGLNIVVGLAGLLDLGYVAFFAIGAFTVAILTAPKPHNIMMDFWLTIPIAVLLASLSGVLLGIPVLRMRGDYLAIVTLGFGEIIRVLAKSDVLTSFTGGPRGIRAVGGPQLFGNDLSTPTFFVYLILLGIALVAFVTYRLQNSRVGRAWMAMREDEDVAEAMGINILKHKLLAFAIGAGFAGLSGAIFASRNRFTGPEDFTLLVSINVLCLVIIGGMGSLPGVVVGALVLKGLPEILRQLDAYRMLAFGALLVIMMIVRPEGLWPSERLRMELHADEDESLVDIDSVAVEG